MQSLRGKSGCLSCCQPEKQRSKKQGACGQGQGLTPSQFRNAATEAAMSPACTWTRAKAGAFHLKPVLRDTTVLSREEYLPQRRSEKARSSHLSSL